MNQQMNQQMNHSIHSINHSFIQFIHSMNLKDIINVNLLSQQTQQKLAEFLGGLDHTIEIHVLPEIAQHAEELQNE